MEPVKALCLDLDDTLLDGSGNRDALARTCDEIAPRIGLEPRALLEANARAWAEYWPAVERRWTLGQLDTETVSLEAWRRALAACGVEDESIVHLVKETHWRLAEAAERLFEDARELLSRLDGALPLALITNGASDLQRRKLRTAGIEDRFQSVIVSGEVGFAKPDAAVFRLALEALGVEPRHAWHVGDNLDNDVGGARGAGLTAVWLNRHGATYKDGDTKPDFEIASLSELPALLQAYR